MTIVVRTNNVPRPIIGGYELTPDERLDFDYLDWTDEGDDQYLRNGFSCDFFRYEGNLYDLGEATSWSQVNPPAKWDGYYGETYFSAIYVRLVDDDFVVVGRATNDRDWLDQDLEKGE